MKLWNSDAYKMLVESDQYHALMEWNAGDLSRFTQYELMALSARRQLLWGELFA